MCLLLLVGRHAHMCARACTHTHIHREWSCVSNAPSTTHTGYPACSAGACCLQLFPDLPGKERRPLLLQLGNPSYQLRSGDLGPVAPSCLWLDNAHLVVAGENLADTPIGDLDHVKKRGQAWVFLCLEACWEDQRGEMKRKTRTRQSLSF